MYIVARANFVTVVGGGRVVRGRPVARRRRRRCRRTGGDVGSAVLLEALCLAQEAENALAPEDEEAAGGDLVHDPVDCVLLARVGQFGQAMVERDQALPAGGAAAGVAAEVAAEG